MGLDTTHECWHGPYSQFMRWREWLAAQIGIPLCLMDGFVKYTYDQSDVDSLGPVDKKRDAIRALAILGEAIPWSILHGDPIVRVLSHSDCDGKIPWWECKGIALRLTEIYRQSREADVFGHGGMDNRRGCYDSMGRATLRFAVGCLRAWKAKEHVQFH